MPLICRPTHTVFLFLSLSVLISLWRTRSPSFYLFFRPSLFSWYLLMKIKFQDISGLKTLFFFMFRKVYIYSKTHPLTRSQKDPPSHKCHINTPFLRVFDVKFKKAEKSRKHLVRRTMTLSLSSKNKSPAAQASHSAGLPHWSDCSKTCPQPLPQKLVLNMFITFHILIPPQYEEGWKDHILYQKTPTKPTEFCTTDVQFLVKSLWVR